MEGGGHKIGKMGQRRLLMSPNTNFAAIFKINLWLILNKFCLIIITIVELSLYGP